MQLRALPLQPWTAGQGGLSEDRGGVFGNTLEGHIIRGLDDPNPDNLLFRDIFLDTTMLARIVMDMPFVDKNRVGAWAVPRAEV